MPDRPVDSAARCHTCGLENPGPEHRSYEPFLCSDRPKPVAAIAFDPATEKVIRDGYEEFACRSLGGFKVPALLHKLREEVEELAEAVEANDRNLFTEELADVIEVCHALAGHSPDGLEEVERARVAKREAKGGFDRGLVMRLADRTADGHGRPL